MATISDFVSIEMGQSPKGEHVNKKGVGLPLLNGPTEFGARHPYPTQFTSQVTREAKAGDLLFCVRGSTTGRMNWAEQRYAIGRGIAAIRHKTDLRLQPLVRAMIEYQLPTLLSAATGSTFPNVTAKMIGGLSYPNLDPSQQLKAAEMLGSLDDKIELNRRMNEVLEGMARAVFRDWFVDFGPTRRKMAGEGNPVKILGGAIRPPAQAQKTAALFPDRLGENGLPEGWEEASIYDYAKIIYGAPFKSKQFNKDARGRPLARIRDLPKNAGGQHTEEVHKKEHLINSGDIVVGMDGEFRAYIWHGEPTLMNQRVCSFVPISAANRAFVWLSIEPLLHFFEETAIATTVIHLGKGDIDTFEVIKSNAALENAFSVFVEPLVEKMVANGKENQTLAEMRDLVLPKLMSGEIRLREGG